MHIENIVKDYFHQMVLNKYKRLSQEASRDLSLIITFVANQQKQLLQQHQHHHQWHQWLVDIIIDGVYAQCTLNIYINSFYFSHRHIECFLKIKFSQAKQTQRFLIFNFYLSSQNLYFLKDKLVPKEKKKKQVACIS